VEFSSTWWAQVMQEGLAVGHNSVTTFLGTPTFWSSPTIAVGDFLGMQDSFFAQI